MQAWRTVTSRPLWANAEVSACRMRLLPFLMRLSKLCNRLIYGKVLLYQARQQSAVGCNAKQLAIFAIETERLLSVIISYFGYTLVAILGDNTLQANFVQFNNGFERVVIEDGMPLQGTFKCFSRKVSAQAWMKSSHLPPQCKIGVFAFQLIGF